MEDCLFCKIVSKKVPAEIVYENRHILAFKDIYPKKPIHTLIIPKIRVISLNDLQDIDDGILVDLLRNLSVIAKQQGLTSGFKTEVNTGIAGGQEIMHLHFHILGDKLRDKE